MVFGKNFVEMKKILNGNKNMNNRKQILDDMRKHGIKMGWAKPNPVEEPIQEEKQVDKPEPKSTQEDRERIEKLKEIDF